MNLRKLKRKDAELMLEWMHDDDVVAKLGTNFKGKTLSDCIRFINSSSDETTDLHLAIVDEEDIYMGTVSLKHINKVDKTAEFAIAVRKSAMGKGYSKYGMSEILRIGIEDLYLDNIYWCVSRENARAVRFYDKNGYRRTTDVPKIITNNYSEEQLSSFFWYIFVR